ncbi:MAG TPA: CorA family divalent cation transporter, partial [Nitrososphaerales archaeon]|nr:CorA family divalent cation transporter [Nitrososphaerales archaeon]
MASPSLTPKSEDGKITSITDAGITWTDVVDPAMAETAILARNYHFHPLDLESCLSTMQLTKIEDHDDYFFIML